ncbi:MAG: ABC transporter permease [Oscillospiraceae bacterium]|nr:ABC transporter permease [Oscillospiraceae bacterium]
MKRFFTLLKNELILSIRDMNMVIFGIIMPLAVFAVLGIIYRSKPAFEGAGFTFLEQSFGAVCAVSICGGGLMGLPLVVSDYREKRILKRFKATPASPALLLGAELAVYILYSAVSLITLAAAGIIAGVKLSGSAAAFLGSWLLTVISTLSIGMMVGGIAKNTKQAGVIASILYFPALIFSGTTLPFEIMPEIMQKIVGLFPLTQGIGLMKSAFLGTGSESSLIAVLVMIITGAVCSGISVRFFKWE